MRSHNIVITVITRYQLVKIVHVFVELIKTCELGVFRELRLETCDRCTSRGTSEKWRAFKESFYCSKKGEIDAYIDTIIYYNIKH